MNYEHLALMCIFGTMYGFIFGIIPIAGAGVALLTIYSFLDLFRGDAYGLVVFTTSIVVSCTIGDLFASIVMNIPGGGGSAATMVDGFPLSMQGKASRALGAAVFSSCSMGILWGVLVFFFLPYYGSFVKYFGIPEMWSFVMLSISCICFVNNKYWLRGIFALGLGIFFGMVGTNPLTASPRFTFDWLYLQDGIQMAPLMAGTMAIPEILFVLWKTGSTAPGSKDNWKQILEGFWDTWHNRWIVFRCGVIGGVIGLLPGIGGPIVDWLSYSSVVASNKNETIPFGKGNIKGVIGPESSVLAQKSTAYIPTVLLGIPAAPFEAVIMSLFISVGLDLGSTRILTDWKFFDSLSFGYMGSLFITIFLALWFIRYAVYINKIPFKYWVIPLLMLIVWSSVQYTRGWEDYVVLLFFAVLGIVMKVLKLSRASFIIGYVLAARLESLTVTFLQMYKPVELLYHPIAVFLLLSGVVAIGYGMFFGKTQLEYH